MTDETVSSLHRPLGVREPSEKSTAGRPQRAGPGLTGGLRSQDLAALLAICRRGAEPHDQDGRPAA